jgi:hypothetical protein
MELIADMLLASGAIGAAFYCVVLSRRLSRFTDLQGGMGGAVAALSTQVDEMTRALERSRRAAGDQSGHLERSTRKAEDVARRLELLVASMHDIPGEASSSARPAAARPADAKPAAKPAAVPPVGPAPAPAPAEGAAPKVASPATPVEAAAPVRAPSRVVPDAALAAAWDDWDPRDVAAPFAAGADASAETTRAPGLPFGARRPDGEAAPASTPIFTAARPTELARIGAAR